MPRPLVALATLAAVLLLAHSPPLHAQTTPNPDRPDRPSLTAKELEKYLEPYVPGVKQCWLDHAKGPKVTGELRLELVIHKNGNLHRFGIIAPGVEGKALTKLETCLRKHSKSWSFPLRGGFTTAVVPFYYQRTNAPGAGPEGTCGKKRGCPKGSQ